MKTLVIASHPYSSKSVVIKSLQSAAEVLENVNVRNLEDLYGNPVDAFDIAAEQAACEEADRIVLMYPTHWFNLTPALKSWLNEVWTYGWAFGPGGHALKGKELLVITSAGASEHTYSHSGLIDSTMDEVLTPIKASAMYVGMNYVEPLAFYEVVGASEDKLQTYRSILSKRLQS